MQNPARCRQPRNARGRPRVRDVRADEIIDVDVDPKDAGRARWRRLARFGVPLAGVILIVAAIIAVTLYSYRSNRNDALALSQNLIAVLDQRVQGEVESYLDPAARAVRTLAGMLSDDGLSSSGWPLLEQLALQLLGDRPQLASLYLGDPQGDFLMVQRSPEGTLDTKLIEQDGAGAPGHLVPARRHGAGHRHREGSGRHVRSPHPAMVWRRDRDRGSVLDRGLRVLHDAGAGPDRGARRPRRRRRAPRGGGRRHHACRAERLPCGPEARSERARDDRRRRGSPRRVSGPRPGRRPGRRRVPARAAGCDRRPGARRGVRSDPRRRRRPVDRRDRRPAPHRGGHGARRARRAGLAAPAHRSRGRSGRVRRRQQPQGRSFYPAASSPWRSAWRGCSPIRDWSPIATPGRSAGGSRRSRPRPRPSTSSPRPLPCSRPAIGTRCNA